MSEHRFLSNGMPLIVLNHIPRKADHSECAQCFSALGYVPLRTPHADNSRVSMQLLYGKKSSSGIVN